MGVFLKVCGFKHFFKLQSKLMPKGQQTLPPDSCHSELRSLPCNFCLVHVVLPNLYFSRQIPPKMSNRWGSWCCKPPRSKENCLDLIMYEGLWGGRKAASSDFKHTQSIQIFIPGILTKRTKKKKKKPIWLDKILLGKQSTGNSLSLERQNWPHPILWLLNNAPR